jgi:hypothetical protein
VTPRTLVRRWWKESIVVLAYCAIIGWILWPFFAAAWNAPAAERELVGFTSKLRLGMSQADVRSRFASAQRELLTLREVDPKLTLINTPPRFGAGDWLAWLDFTDGRLVSVRVRIADSRDSKPDGSPPDVGVPPPSSR